MDQAEASPTRKRLLSWTVCGYRKPDLSEQEYHKYVSEVHAPLLRDLLVKYGMIRWSYTHNTSAMQPLLQQVTGPRTENQDDCDLIMNIVFPDVSCFVELRKDPIFVSKVMPDHANFADTKRSRMTLGWIEDIIADGQLVT